MNVYMRTSDEARGAWFCDWDPTRMDELVAALRAGGGVYSGESEFLTEITYQFIHDERGSGAEIVLHAEATEYIDGEALGWPRNARTSKGFDDG